MPIFRQPLEKTVNNWDIVDFEGTDGRIHRGIVTDVIERGFLNFHQDLLVDELAGRNPLLQSCVPLHKTMCFEPETYLTFPYPRRSGTVQILLQTSPNTLWTWFPGRLVLSDQRSFALVRIRNPDVAVGEIVVSPALVRFDHPEKCMQIDRDDFIKKTVVVPEEFVLDDNMRSLWEKKFPGTKPCTISNSSLKYLQAYPKSGEKKLIKITTAMFRDLAEEIDKKTTLKTDTHAYDGPCIHYIIPKEIMAKIFRYLYTEQQANARRVCRQWNCWLQYPVFSKEVRFDLCGENRYLSENDCLRKFFTYIHGVLGPNCKTIVLTAGNGNVIRHLFHSKTSHSPCLFDQLVKIIDPACTCSITFPDQDTSHPESSTVYTFRRGGVRCSFKLVILRIYSYHGRNEQTLRSTAFPEDVRSKPGLPKALKPFNLLSGVQSISSVCISNPTRCVFAAGDTRDQHILIWDMRHKSSSGSISPSYRTRCFGEDYVVQLKISADGRVLFAGGEREIAVLDICEGVPKVKTMLRNSLDSSSCDDYYGRNYPMVVSDDGNTCFVARVGQMGGEVLVWDVRTGLVANRFRALSNFGEVQCMDQSRDGLTLWTSGQDMKVRAWDTRTFTQRRQLDMTGLNVYAISCCPNNEWIAVGTKKKFRHIDVYQEWTPERERQFSLVVEIFNLTKPEEYLVETLNDDRSGLLKYSPSGDWLISTSEVELHLLHHPYGYLAYRDNQPDNYCHGACDISADGQFVAKGVDGGVMVYEVAC